MARRKRKLEPVVIDNGERAVRKVDGTPLYGKDAARYVQKLAESYMDREVFLRTDKAAPEHHLCWLEGDDAPMPQARSVNWEMVVDEFGAVQAAVALRNMDDEPIAAAKMSTTDMVELGKWLFKTAFFKLGLVKDGIKAPVDDLATAKAVMVDQVNDILDSLMAIAPEIVTERLSSHGKRAVRRDVEKQVVDTALEKAGKYVQSERLRHAHELVAIAKIATRADQESREDALQDPLIEKSIVQARELIDAHREGLQPPVITR